MSPKGTKGINAFFSNEFSKIAKKYKLNLEGSWNKVTLPHSGRHPYDYHGFVLEEIRKIDRIAKGNSSVFLKLFNIRIRNIIINNPDRMYSLYYK